MKKSPLAIMKDKMGEQDRAKAKAKLVEAVRKLAGSDLWVERFSDKGVEHVSNKKLLHLHDLLTRVKDEFGSRDGLLDAILKLEKREKDEGYKSRLTAWSTPRLVDHHDAAKARVAS